jgi:hypothetical protein
MLALLCSFSVSRNGTLSLPRGRLDDSDDPCSGSFFTSLLETCSFEVGYKCSFDGWECTHTTSQGGSKVDVDCKACKETCTLALNLTYSDDVLGCTGSCKKASVGEVILDVVISIISVILTALIVIGCCGYGPLKCLKDCIAGCCCGVSETREVVIVPVLETPTVVEVTAVRA